MCCPRTLPPPPATPAPFSLPKISCLPRAPLQCTFLFPQFPVRNTESPIVQRFALGHGQKKWCMEDKAHAMTCPSSRLPVSLLSPSPLSTHALSKSNVYAIHFGSQQCIHWAFPRCAAGGWLVVGLTSVQCFPALWLSPSPANAPPLAIPLTNQRPPQPFCFTSSVSQAVWKWCGGGSLPRLQRRGGGGTCSQLPIVRCGTSPNPTNPNPNSLPPAPTAPPRGTMATCWCLR